MAAGVVAGMVATKTAAGRFGANGRRQEELPETAETTCQEEIKALEKGKSKDDALRLFYTTILEIVLYGQEQIDNKYEKNPDYKEIYDVEYVQGFSKPTNEMWNECSKATKKKHWTDICAKIRKGASEVLDEYERLKHADDWKLKESKWEKVEEKCKNSDEDEYNRAKELYRNAENLRLMEKAWQSNEEFMEVKNLVEKANVFVNIPNNF